MTQEEKINQLDRNLSVQVLLESMLYSHICDNYERMKEACPSIANLVRNDLQTLHRNHEFYMAKIRPIVNKDLISDYESLRNIIEEFISDKQCEKTID